MERSRAGQGGHGNGRKPPHSSRGRLVAAVLLVLAAHFLLQPVAFSFAGGSGLQAARSRPQASLLPRSFFAAPAPLPTEEELEELEREDEAAAEAASKILAEAAEKAEEAAQKAAEEASAKPIEDMDDGDFFSLGSYQEVDTFKDVPPDQWLKGKVNVVKPFGILVDVAHPDTGDVVTALVHISQMSQGFVSEEALQNYSPGQEVEVRVLGVDVAENKLRLSMRPERDGPKFFDWEGFRAMEKDEPIVGTVTGHAVMGLFVLVEKPYGTGMIFKSLLPNIEVWSDRFPLGQELKVNVLRLREDERKIDFKLDRSEEEVAEEAQTDPTIGTSSISIPKTDLDGVRKVPPGTYLTGTIYRIVDFGLFLKVDKPAANGLLHISKLPVTQDLLAETYKVGQEIEVLIDNVRDNGQVDFALEATQNQGLEIDWATVKKLPSGTMLSGTIYNVVDFGVFVKVDKPAVHGLVHVSNLPRMGQKGTEAFEVGQELEVYVLSITNKGVNFGMKVDDTFDQFAKLTPDTVLKGTIQAVLKSGIIVDAALTPDGPWAQGRIQSSQLPKNGPPKDYAQGQELGVVVLGVEDRNRDDGKLRLKLGLPTGRERPPLRSLPEADTQPLSNDIAAIQKVPSGTLLTATVQKILTNGLIVQVQQPFATGLLHSSHMPQTKRSLDEVYEVGQEVEVYVKSLWDGKVNFAMQVDDPLTEFGKLSSKTRLKARVTRALDFGLLVEAEVTPDGPFATGLLHKSQMQGRAPEDYTVGEELEVVVEKVDVENHQLGFRVPESSQAKKGPQKNDLEGIKQLPPRAPLRATIRKIIDSGVIVEVDKPFATGLLHANKMPKTGRTLDEVYELDQELEVYVHTVRENGKVDFAMEVDHALEKFQPLMRGTTMLRATVKKVAKFGLIVEAEITPEGPWAVGLLHKSRMKAFAPEGYVAGQELKVEVFNVDIENKQIAFTQTGNKARPLEVVINTPEIVKAFAEAPKTQPLKGMVRNAMPFGLMIAVDLTPNGPVGSGLLHKSEINGDYRPEDYSIGQEITVSLLSVNIDKVEISLTQPVGLMARVVAAHQIGVFVEVEDGGKTVEGVVEPSTFTSEALKKDPAAFLARGQKVLVSELPGGDRGKFFTFVDEESIVGVQSGSAVEDALASEAPLDLDDSEGSDSLPPEINKIYSQYEGPLSDNGYDELDLLRQLNEKEWAEMAQVIGMAPSDAAKLRAAL